MSTVELICTNCLKPFQKNKHEISRRKAKSRCSTTNWFCSRSCAVSYSNKNRDFGPPPQFGNQHGRKWNEELSWYMNRICADGRDRCKATEDRQTLHDHLKHIWNGKCAVTGRVIKRKTRTGFVNTRNPFEIASLDRINNDQPYQVGNVQWVSLAINRARGNLPLDEFKVYLNGAA